MYLFFLNAIIKKKIETTINQLYDTFDCLTGRVKTVFCQEK